MRSVSQVEPRPTVVVTRSVPVGFSEASVRRDRTASSFCSHVVGGAEEMLALLGEDQAAGMAVEERDAEILLERATCRLTADWLMLSVLAGVGEGAGLRGRVEDAELVPVHRPPPGRLFRRFGGLARASARYFSASSAAMQPRPAAVTAWRKTSSVTSPAAKTPGIAGRGRIRRRPDIAAAASCGAGRRGIRSPAHGRWRRRRRRP